MLKNFKYTAGDKVSAGFYWNRTEWEAQIVPAEGAALKGVPGTKYLRVPLLLVLVAAPLMGLAYAMFLPFIGFAMLAMYLTGRMKGHASVTPPASENAAAKKAA